MGKDSKLELKIEVELADVTLAWQHVRRSRRNEVKDWLALQTFGYPGHTSKYIALLLEKLKQGKYEPTPAAYFDKPKTDRSLRQFAFLDFEDRLVYQLLCNKLISFTYDDLVALNHQQRVFGNIPNNPHGRKKYVFLPPFDITLNNEVVLNGQFDLFRHRVLKSYDEFAERDSQSWFIRTDIRSYYPSVDHVTLEGLMAERGWLPETNSRILLMECLDLWASDKGKGIPIGYECSDHKGNLYVQDLDKALQEFRSHRYVDDTYVFVDDYEQVKEVLYRIDKTLKRLGLQRNTSKTMVHHLENFSRDQFEKMLSENLSVFAEEKLDLVAETQRQDALLEILWDSFEPHFDEDIFSAKITDIRRVAFVLYRLDRKGKNIRELAYHILDHDLNYAYHALSYLYLNHPDSRLQHKLESVLTADYEPRALKAFALVFLSLIDVAAAICQLERILERSDPEDWYVLRIFMQEAIDYDLASYPIELLKQLLHLDNRFLQVYAQMLFLRAETDDRLRSRQIDQLFQSEHRIVKCLGINLTYLFGLESRVTATFLDAELRTLLSVETIETIEFCRQCFSEVFGISLDENFPFEEYIGRITDIIQVLRNVYATKEQGIDKFTLNLYVLVESILVNATNKQHGANTVCDIDSAVECNGDYELEKFVDHLQKRVRDFRCRRKHGTEGEQINLIADFNRSFSVMFNRLHWREGLRMRNEVFISYAHADDDKWHKLVRQHLAPYVNYDKLSVWSDHDIGMGQDWDDEIKQALERAKVAILLVSPAFLDSSYIHNKELPDLMKASESDGLTIAWIHVIPSAVDDFPLGKLQAAHQNPSTTLSAMDEQELHQTLVDVCRKVSKLMGEG